ncbi:MAG: hypothetical protein Q4B09_09210 [Lachnospiraceae bacterium]|nr:hypothetical protein [Lachnospiraceae bacterium]
MLIDSKIERYVSKVTAKLPLRERNRANHELFQMIRNLVIDYAGDHEPDVLDARAVLSELGDPEEVAESWMEQIRSERAIQKESVGWFGEVSEAAGILTELRDRASQTKLKNVMTFAHAQKFFAMFMEICTGLSICLVVFGLLGLGTHAIHSMLPIFVGCIMELLVITGKSVLIRQY